MHQLHPDGHPLALSARHAPDLAVSDDGGRRVLEAQVLQHLLHPALYGVMAVAAATTGCSVQPRRQRQRLAHRHVGEEQVVLSQEGVTKNTAIVSPA